MKLLDALQERGFPYEIPGAVRNDLPGLCVALGFKRGAEIGVYRGWNLKKYLAAGLEMYGIDPWEPYSQQGLPESFDPAWLARRHRREAYNHEAARQNVQPWLDSGKCQLLKGCSMDLVPVIPEGSLDFVYLDGNHSFRYVAEDLAEWTFKVRRGGLVAGHDYSADLTRLRDRAVLDVKFALEAWLRSQGIDHFYVLGRERPEIGERFDEFRSWFWVRE